MPYPTFKRYYEWHLGAQMDRDGKPPIATRGRVERTRDGEWKATAPGVEGAGYGKTKKGAVLNFTNVNAT